MLPRVIARRHQFQVLFPIIGLVTIDMMHMLLAGQGSANDFFHNQAMFIFLASADNNIPLNVD